MPARPGRTRWEFRRTLLQRAPRYLAVLNLAAEKAGWGRKVPPGRALGVALHESFGSIVAEVAEVAGVSLEGGKPRVHRVVCAVDCGTVINPNIVAQQMESSVICWGAWVSRACRPSRPPVANALFALTGKRHRALPLSA